MGFLDRFSKTPTKMNIPSRAYKCSCGNPIFFANRTWAHLLHMADTLSTALSFGLEPARLDLEIEPYTKDALYRPDDPGAMHFLGFSIHGSR